MQGTPFLPQLKRTLDFTSCQKRECCYRAYSWFNRTYVKLLTDAWRKGPVRAHELLERSSHGLCKDAEDLIHCFAHCLPNFWSCQGLQDLNDSLHQHVPTLLLSPQICILL